MFERFTKSARAAVIRAQEEARDLGSPAVDVEHVLLGVINTSDGVLHTLLDELGLTVDAARTAVLNSNSTEEEPLGDEDAEALRLIGIDLDKVRASLESNFGVDALDQRGERPRRRRVGGHLRFRSGSKKVLELALREALANRDNHIGSEHILLAIVRAPNDVARSVIEARVPLPELRRQVVQLLDRAA